MTIRGVARTATIRRLAALLAVTIAAGVTAGCAKPPAPPQPPQAQGASAPVTTPAEATATVLGTTKPVPVVVSRGPITHPPAGSAARKAILDAARTGLGISSSFTVIQLYVQGDAALADLVPVGGTAGQRRYLALRRNRGSWIVMWRWPHEPPHPDIRAEMPYASPELVAKLMWDRPLPVDTSGLKASAEAAALKVASRAGGSTVGTLKVTTAATKLVRDRTGTWWASVVVASDKTGIDALTVYLKRPGSTWTSIDFGTGIDTSTDPHFPAEVRGKL
jgi:hypothetical protein